MNKQFDQCCCGFEEVSVTELQSISGGGFWGDVGRWAGEAYCSVKEAFLAMSEATSYGASYRWK